MFWLIYDPLTFIAMIIAYTVGFMALQFLAAKIAPKFASSLSGKLSLYTAMFLTAFIIVVGGGIAIYAIYTIASSQGYQLPVLAIIGLAAVFSLISYLLSPFMINAAYRAQEDPRLQEIVDIAASKAGIKPPKAVVVEGPPNAFAYGNFLSGRYVAVSSQLYQMLSRDELLAVVGHELGHHRHRDTVVLLLLGLIPSVLYYMGIWLIRAGIVGAGYRDREGNSGGLVLLAAGIASVILSFIMQVAVLAFSRLREYYADAHGAIIAGARSMQRALAKIHLYYSGSDRARGKIEKSSVKALFIYALVEAVANPLYSPYRRRWISGVDVDSVIERIKEEPVDPVQEIFSDHPPIPKRLRFLDQVASRTS